MSDNNGTFSIADVVKDIEKERQERAERNRTFELGGETFTHKPSVSMDALAEYFDMAMGQEMTNAESVAVIDRTIEAFLVPEDIEKWKKVRSADHPNPVTHSDAHNLIAGLVTSLSARPIMPPSESTDGQETTTTTSTAGSRSKASKS